MSRVRRQMSNVKCQKFALSLLFLFLIPQCLSAAMQSSSYIIYENVMHSFDGPVISNVNATASDGYVTVTWDTNIESDSFVIYSTDAAFTTSAEQGTSHKAHTSHSVELTGLEANTTYYYRVRSERVNGGITTDPTVRTFNSGSGSGSTSGSTQEEASGGGGVVIIDKTDKEAPLITNVTVNKEDPLSISIEWETSEDATAFVEYGRTANYGNTYGTWATGTSHSVSLPNLTAGALYHFRAISSDSWGNIGYSGDLTFSTTEGDEEGVEITPEEEEELGPELEPGYLDTEVSDRILQFIQRIFPAVSINDLAPGGIVDINSLDELSGFVPAPVLSGEPRVEIGATQATIFWTSDVESNSLVAIAPEDAYNPGAEEPYRQIVGNPDERTTTHEVTVYDLSPETTYHFQLRSRGDIGPQATSRDFTFTTSLEELTITSAFFSVEDDSTAVFRWVTNKNADSAVRFTPYYNGSLDVTQSKVIRDNEQSVIHEVEVSEFQGGVYYQVELISIDAEGNTASEDFDQFATAEDDFPPEVSHIKADSTVFVDRGNKIQTIISWLTNEPSTSRVYFQEGVHGTNVDLAESTDLNTNYTKEHVMVITKFKPGVVYTFRVESIDSGGHVSTSKPHTFMTAKKKESIIQIIMNILENTFGWVKKLM